MTTSTSCGAALKEWAVAVEALGTGRQTLILRKGGIREENNRFEVVFPEFLLSPSFEHQQAGLLKDEYAGSLASALNALPNTEEFRFRYLAKVHRVFSVSEEREIKALSPFHIWSDNYAQSRLRWRPRVPLTAMVLRIYELETPAQVPARPEYVGCRSWIRLLDDAEVGSPRPVLDDGTFTETANAIVAALHAARSITNR